MASWLIRLHKVLTKASQENSRLKSMMATASPPSYHHNFNAASMAWDAASAMAALGAPPSASGPSASCIESLYNDLGVPFESYLGTNPADTFSDSFHFPHLLAPTGSMTTTECPSDNKALAADAPAFVPGKQERPSSRQVGPCDLHKPRSATITSTQTPCPRARGDHYRIITM